MAKKYVSVLALYVPEGRHLARLRVSPALISEYKVVPCRVLTEDDKTIYVDKVLDIRNEASIKAGGLGVRYTCLVTVEDVQKEIFVYRDDTDWYLE